MGERRQLFGIPSEFVIGLITAVVIVALALGIVLGGAFKGSATVAATTTVGAPTATQLPPATNTPSGPRILTGATIGGAESAFDTAFGTQVSRWTWNTTIVSKPVTVFLDMAPPAESADGQNHAYILDLSMPTSGGGDKAWSAQTALAIATFFFPSDATHVRDAQGANAGQVDHIYHSADLAATFHADIFTNDAGNVTDAPGTFHFECGASSTGSTTFRECIMSVGTQN